MNGDIWKVIRAEYARRWDAIRPVGRKTKAHGATQATVAEFGGLPRQNAISRILNNRKDGPTVETFVRGLIGMGVKPSDFFLAVEKQLPLPVVPPPWGPAANAPSTDVRRSAAHDAADAQRSIILKAGQHARQMFELFAGREGLKKRR